MKNIKMLDQDKIEQIITDYIEKQAVEDLNGLRRFLFSFNTFDEFSKVAKIGVFILHDKKKPFVIKD